MKMPEEKIIIQAKRKKKLGKLTGLLRELGFTKVKTSLLPADFIVKAPGRISVIGKIKQGIENLSDIKETDEERSDRITRESAGY